MGNVTTLSCSPDGQHGYVCVRYHYWFAILTLLFIYLPSVNVIATLYGPKTAGIVAYFKGLAIAVLGGILATTGYLVHSPGTATSGWFIICIGVGVVVMGWVSNKVTGKFTYEVYHFLLFIPLLIFSPVIFISLLSNFWQHSNHTTSSSRTSQSIGVEGRPF